MRCYYLVLDPYLIDVHHLLFVFTFKNKQVLYCELFLFGPPNAEPCIFIETRLGVRHIQQIEYLLVVDLQKGTENRDMAILRSLLLFPENISNHPRNYPKVLLVHFF